jgi:hypothetical protein
MSDHVLAFMFLLDVCDLYLQAWDEHDSTYSATDGALYIPSSVVVLSVSRTSEGAQHCKHHTEFSYKFS